MTAKEWADQFCEPGRCPVYDLANAYLLHFHGWGQPGALGFAIGALAKAGLLNADRTEALVRPKSRAT